MAEVEVIDRWVAEFFIFHKKNPRVSPINLLSALKFGDSSGGDCSKLTKAAVLRGLSDSLLHGKLDEETLDLLEVLEKLGGSVQPTESHKSAYCWTAVECTTRLMWPLDPSEGLYEDGLERIWTKRVRVLKESGKSGLVESEELLKWEDDLRKAAEDPEVYRRIRETNVTYTAVCFLHQLLKEQWGVLGSCSSLESVAQRMLLKRKGADKGDGGGVGSREDPIAVDEGEEENGEDSRDVHGVVNDEQRAAEEEERTMVGTQEQEQRLLRRKRKGVDKGDGGGVRSREVPNGVDEGEKENGEDTRDLHGVENDEQHAAEEEERTMVGAQEPSLDKGDEMAARELKEYLLEIQRQIEPSSTRQSQEPITPLPSRVSRTGTSGQQQDNASEKSSSGGRVRPRLPTPVPLNVSPLRKKKANPVTRRPKNFWTTEEMEVLREAVKEHGKAWIYIKKSNPVVFAKRTDVDLKDKWRNMTRQR